MSILRELCDRMDDVLCDLARSPSASGGAVGEALNELGQLLGELREVQDAAEARDKHCAALVAALRFLADESSPAA